MYQYDNLQQWLCCFGTRWSAKRQCHLHSTPANFYTCETWILCRTFQILGANDCFFDAMSKSKKVISVIDSIAKARTPAPIKHQNYYIYNKIPLSGLQQSARHALAHDELLQMGSDGIHGALSYN